MDPYAGIGTEVDPYAGIGAEVTDPDLLRQLNAGQEVTDPALLAQLNGTVQSNNVPVPNSATDFGGNTLQVLNPFGKNFDTGINLGRSANNLLTGVGKFYSDAVLGARQIYGRAADTVDPLAPTMSGLITGQQPSRSAALYQAAADKRAIDTDISGTTAGKIGEVAGSLPLLAVPGANTYAGAALIGGATAALRPTVAGESRTLNTAAGAGLGVGGKYLGDSFSSWLRARAAQPFMGWSLKTGNQAAAQAVGSDASKLDQAALKDTADRLGGIFEQARDPSVNVNLGGSTAQQVTNAAQGLNASSRQALESNPQIGDLMAHLRNGSANAEQLGAISSSLGKDAASQMRSQMGDRQLGQALFDVKEHVDDLIGQSIQNPDLKAAYDAARP